MIPDLIGSRKEMFGGGDIGKAIAETEWLMSKKQPTPPEPAPAADESLPIKFIDYEGTLLYSYSKEDFLALSEMPANPSHSGLTAQGWNWSLSDAKEHVTVMDELIIGQTYITDDGKTRAYVTLMENTLTLYLNLYIDGSIEIDWGDGSNHDIMRGSSFSALISQGHTYETTGNYIITLTVTGQAKIEIDDDVNCGWFLAYNPNTQTDYNEFSLILTEIYIGENMLLGACAFYNYSYLEKITIPNGITELRFYSLSGCSSLRAVVLPNGLIQRDADFSGDGKLEIISLPKSLGNLGSDFFRSTGLRFITLPYTGINSLDYYCFANCPTLSTITIPSSITSISQAFSGDAGLKKIIFKSSVPPTFESAYVWSAVGACMICVPEGSLSAYLSAPNCPDPSVYTYIEYTP